MNCTQIKTSFRYCSHPAVATNGSKDAGIEGIKELLQMLTDGETDVDKLKDVAKYPKLAAFIETHCRSRQYTFQVC